MEIKAPSSCSADLLQGGRRELTTQRWKKLLELSASGPEASQERFEKLQASHLNFWEEWTIHANCAGKKSQLLATELISWHLFTGERMTTFSDQAACKTQARASAGHGSHRTPRRLQLDRSRAGDGKGRVWAATLRSHAVRPRLHLWVRTCSTRRRGLPPTPTATLTAGASGSRSRGGWGPGPGATRGRFRTILLLIRPSHAEDDFLFHQDLQLTLWTGSFPFGEDLITSFATPSQVSPRSSGARAALVPSPTSLPRPATDSARPKTDPAPRGEGRFQNSNGGKQTELCCFAEEGPGKESEAPDWRSFAPWRSSDPFPLFLSPYFSVGARVWRLSAPPGRGDGSAPQLPPSRSSRSLPGDAPRLGENVQDWAKACSPRRASLRSETQRFRKIHRKAEQVAHSHQICGEKPPPGLCLLKERTGGPSGHQRPCLL